MAKKKRTITPMHYFVFCIVFTMICCWLMVPGAGATLNAAAPVHTAVDDVPTVFIREDTCETLLKKFCENHGNVKYTTRPLGNRYEVVIYNFGANKEQFYNNNSKLPSITDRGFIIETHSDTLKAQFIRKDIKAASCVELPSDVLYALMAQHPLIK